MNRHQKFMTRAIKLSEEHMQAGHGGPFGAVIVKDDKIIGEGWNQVTTTNDPTAHAEVSAIREACKNLSNFDLQGAVIYTSCEPCPMCLSAIYWARLDKIYYGNSRVDAANIQFDDDFLYKEVSLPIDQRKIPAVQIERDQAIKVFEAWQKKSDKIPY